MIERFHIIEECDLEASADGKGFVKVIDFGSDVKVTVIRNRSEHHGNDATRVPMLKLKRPVFNYIKSVHNKVRKHFPKTNELHYILVQNGCGHICRVGSVALEYKVVEGV